MPLGKFTLAVEQAAAVVVTATTVARTDIGCAVPAVAKNAQEVLVSVLVLA